MLPTKGGNPTKDRQDAKSRFETVIKPALENLGFKQIKGNGYDMVNEKTNQIVMITSAPSNLKIIPATKNMIRRYRKQYENPAIYYLFSRDTSDYPTASGTVYVEKLNKISAMNLLSGVSTGLNFLPMVIDSLKNQKKYRFISV